MLDRFYVPDLLLQATIRLSGPEAHHLSRVLRKQRGDEVSLFDGQGREARARVESIARDSVSLSALAPPVHRLLSGPRVTLATAVPKGERARWLVEKATELGALAWAPLLCERSVVDPGTTKLEKLKQTVIAACKQCGRNDLMRIHPPQSWDGFLREDHQKKPLLVADRSGRALAQERIARLEALTVAIGPEGGLTDAELESARARGARVVGLSESILRIETAAVAALSVCRLSLPRNDSSDLSLPF